MNRPVPLIVSGVLGIAAAVVLGAVVPDEHRLAVMVPGCLLACAFAWGVGRLSDPWLVLPALMVLVPGTAVLVGDGHRALMDLVAHRETCVVERVDEVTGTDTPAYAHRVRCLDGAVLTVVVQGEADKRVPPGPVAVLRHEWMRPLLADRNDWSAEWVFGVPIAIFVLLICATSLRARRVMRQA
ncbi:hypothetical protein [Nocardia sp. NRRL S-836]|uniref:hypothetical protein n=1 Tax=Nocardia sp. NRRL S-836 TaxID=1519492 RepID=UPI0006ADBCD0|nr:hypothetical protein [Nocardia sp. NRRL S-836]KOV79869.1 hypothetical protein ADL03_35455 [Nocardia sp. NRRL S-836]